MIPKILPTHSLMHSIYMRSRLADAEIIKIDRHWDEHVPIKFARWNSISPFVRLCDNTILCDLFMVELLFMMDAHKKLKIIKNAIVLWRYFLLVVVFLGIQYFNHIRRIHCFMLISYSTLSVHFVDIGCLFNFRIAAIDAVAWCCWCQILF